VVTRVLEAQHAVVLIEDGGRFSEFLVDEDTLQPILDTGRPGLEQAANYVRNQPGNALEKLPDDLVDFVCRSYDILARNVVRAG
jgi:hypothetical protein